MHRRIFYLVTALVVWVISLIIIEGQAWPGGTLQFKETQLLEMIMKEHPHRMMTGKSIFQTNGQLVSQAIWNPDDTFRSGLLASDGEVITEILFSKIIKYKNRVEMYVVTTSNTRLNSCHVCAPIIGCSIFEFTKKHWELKTNLLKIGSAGTWGIPPKMELVQIGPDCWGIVGRYKNMSQGLRTEIYELFLISEDDQNPLLSMNILTDDRATIIAFTTKEFTREEARISFIPCNSCEYFDILVHTAIKNFLIVAEDKFVQQGITQKETHRYTFKNGKYQEVSN